MKHLTLLLLLLAAVQLSGKAQTVITYTYDDAGNRVSRTSSAEVAAAYGVQNMDESTVPELEPLSSSYNEDNVLGIASPFIRKKIWKDLSTCLQYTGLLSLWRNEFRERTDDVRIFDMEPRRI